MREREKVIGTNIEKKDKFKRAKRHVGEVDLAAASIWSVTHTRTQTQPATKVCIRKGERKK